MTGEDDIPLTKRAKMANAVVVLILFEDRGISGNKEVKE